MSEAGETGLKIAVGFVLISIIVMLIGFATGIIPTIYSHCDEVVETTGCEKLKCMEEAASQPSDQAEFSQAYYLCELNRKGVPIR
jgi:hypothetical protein